MVKSNNGTRLLFREIYADFSTRQHKIVQAFRVKHASILASTPSRMDVDNNENDEEKKTIVSELARVEGRVADYCRARLVEIWAEGEVALGKDALERIQREVLDEVAELGWDDWGLVEDIESWEWYDRGEGENESAGSVRGSDNELKGSRSRSGFDPRGVDEYENRSRTQFQDPGERKWQVVELKADRKENDASDQNKSSTTSSAREHQDRYQDPQSANHSLTAAATLPTTLNVIRCIFIKAYASFCDWIVVCSYAEATQLMLSWWLWIFFGVMKLVFITGAIYIVFSALFLAIGFVPVIGPLVKYGLSFFWKSLVSLATKLPANISGGSAGTLDPITSALINIISGIFSYFHPAPAEKTVDFHSIPVRFSSIAVAINSTMQLSQLGIHMLPTASILEHSSRSILRASNIVHASGVYRKQELMASYDVLHQSTHELSNIMSEYDVKVTEMILEAEIHLSITLQNIHGHLNWLDFRTPFTTLLFYFSFAISITSAAASLYLRHLPHSLILGGTLSLAITTQTDCVRYNPTLTAIQPWCIPLNIVYPGLRSERQAEALEVKATLIAREFYYFYEIYLDNILQFLKKAEDGARLSDVVQKHYNIVNSIWLRNENPVIHKTKRLGAKAAEPLGWTAWIIGRMTDLDLRDKSKLVSLEGQVRNPQELSGAHQAARNSFQLATGLLTEMKITLYGMLRGVQQMQGMGRRNMKEWYSLLREIEKMQPLIDDLKDIGDYATQERKKHVTLWRGIFLSCLAQGEGYDKCMFGDK